MRAAALAGAVALAVVTSLLLGPAAGRGAGACDAPVAYPGDDAAAVAIADWMARGARARGIPPELPVMASLVESGLRNLSSGDSDSAGYFQMRRSLWDSGAYAGFPTNPDLQLTWFADQAIAIRSARVAGGDTAYGADPGRWGEWIADVERPAEQHRGRYQLRLDEARALVGTCQDAPAETLAVTTETLPPATVGVPYRVDLTATGSGALTWSVTSGALPSGLALAADGAISGTPGVATPRPVGLTVGVTNGAIVAARSLTLDVVDPLAVARPVVALAEAGRPIRPITLRAAGGRSPYTWQLVGAPPWLDLGRGSPRLTGTPSAAGTFRARVSLEDAYATTAGLEVLIAVRERLRLRRSTLPPAAVGRLYRANPTTTGGVPPLRWRASGLPAGVTIGRTTGRLVGRPVDAGRHPVAVTVTDALGARATIALTLRVAAVRRG